MILFVDSKFVFFDCKGQMTKGANQMACFTNIEIDI